jgi:hypothetical protein
MSQKSWQNQAQCLDAKLPCPVKDLSLFDDHTVTNITKLEGRMLSLLFVSRKRN